MVSQPWPRLLRQEKSDWPGFSSSVAPIDGKEDEHAPPVDLTDGQIAHAGHAKIARRVNLSQAVALAPSGKSGPLISPSRAHKEGASRSSRNVVRDAMDAAASNDE